MDEVVVVVLPEVVLSVALDEEAANLSNEMAESSIVLVSVRIVSVTVPSFL